MNRRSFFGSLLGGLSLCFLPKAPRFRIIRPLNKQELEGIAKAKRNVNQIWADTERRVAAANGKYNLNSLGKS